MTGGPLRVVFATRMPAGRGGGIESAVRELAPRIAARRPGWKVDLVFAFARVTRLNGLPLLGDLVAGVMLAFKTRAADIVLVNGAEYAWPRTLRARERERTVVVWHGTRAGEIPALVRTMSLPVRIYHALETRLQGRALRARRQIAVSITTASEIERTYGNRVRIAVVPNGAPVPLAARAGASARRAHRVAWVGTNAYKKGLDIALAACALARERFADIELVIIGLAAPQRTAPQWQRYTGRLAHAAAIDCLESAAVLLATSRYEGCSVAVLEALALGVPVVAGPSVAWMAGAAGVAVAGDADEPYAEALCALFAQPERLRAMAEAAPERARAFDWNNAAAAYAAEIEACLSDP